MLSQKKITASISWLPWIPQTFVAISQEDLICSLLTDLPWSILLVVNNAKLSTSCLTNILYESHQALYQ